MSRYLRITFRDTPDLHRLRNFAEEIALTFGERGLGDFTIGEADIARDEICVKNIRARMLKRAVAYAEELVIKHGFNAEAVIETGAMQDFSGTNAT